MSEYKGPSLVGRIVYDDMKISVECTAYESNGEDPVSGSLDLKHRDFLHKDPEHTVDNALTYEIFNENYKKVNVTIETSVGANTDLNENVVKKITPFRTKTMIPLQVLVTFSSALGVEGKDDPLLLVSALRFTMERIPSMNKDGTFDYTVSTMWMSCVEYYEEGEKIHYMNTSISDTNNQLVLVLNKDRPAEIIFVLMPDLYQYNRDDNDSHFYSPCFCAVHAKDAIEIRGGVQYSHNKSHIIGNAMYRERIIDPVDNFEAGEFPEHLYKALEDNYWSYILGDITTMFRKQIDGKDDKIYKIDYNLSIADGVGPIEYVHAQDKEESSESNGGKSTEEDNKEDKEDD